MFLANQTKADIIEFLQTYSVGKVLQRWCTLRSSQGYWARPKNQFGYTKDKKTLQPLIYYQAITMSAKTKQKHLWWVGGTSNLALEKLQRSKQPAGCSSSCFATTQTVAGSLQLHNAILSRQPACVPWYAQRHWLSNPLWLLESVPFVNHFLDERACKHGERTSNVINGHYMLALPSTKQMVSNKCQKRECQVNQCNASRRDNFNGEEAVGACCH